MRINSGERIGLYSADSADMCREESQIVGDYIILRSRSDM